MTKVIIDSFDTEEQAVAFVYWFEKKCTQDILLLTTLGPKLVGFDGVDTYNYGKNQIVVNITVDNLEDEGI